MGADRATAASYQRQSLAVYAAGLVQGIVLVTLPAASTVFTDPSGYDLSTGAYGALFVPQVAAAIATSLLGPRIGRAIGAKRLYQAGLLVNLASMLLLLASATVEESTAVAYPLLLAAATGVGAGFGLTVPVLNSLTAALHPRTVDGSVLVLNALLGVGTVLAPLFVAVFVGLGFWWGLPATSALLLVGLVAVTLRLPVQGGAHPRGAGRRVRLPARFWVYAGFITLYGALETANGNWSSLTMTSELGASSGTAALALTGFWAMVTAGRVFFALIHRWFRTRWTFHLLPFVLAGAFLLIWSLPADGGGAWLGLVGFGLAGLGCSALLPLTISFAQEELTAASAQVTGGIIAFYQLGYGIAAFGIGPVHGAGVALSDVYGVAALAALALGVFSFLVAGRRPMPASLHPRPA